MSSLGDSGTFNAMLRLTPELITCAMKYSGKKKKKTYVIMNPQ